MAIGEYIASVRKNISSSGTYSFLINNPDNNDYKMHINRLVVGTDQLLDIDVDKNVSIDSNGTSIDILNSELNATNTSSMRVEEEGSYSGGSTFYTGAMYQRCIEPVIGTTDSQAEDLVLSDGNNLLIKLTNQGDSSSTSTIELRYSEISY